MPSTHLIDPSASTEAKVQYLLDREALKQLIVSISAFDFEDWDKYKNLFTDEVRMDVAEEGEFWTGTIAEFADMIAPAFAALDASQHLIIPITIHVDGDHAKMKAYVRGYERRAAAPGEQEHRISAHYDFEAHRTDEGWKMSMMKKSVFWHDGNMGVLGEG